ncbi:hypothetical protein [Methanobrevibacter sp.]|uniref:hypothetical protein n=1 Tax=Methanobrevibacter sp. TaxID=66852 RepID=UPI0025E2468A|nr:hypothetical protein [Methanobrevibacter sp.]MBQ6512543.1 hypothetical protein [Methanobrevibacter sp.]
MSELSELIEINRNIEKQNEEIIRLLRIIAGEKDSAYETPTVEIPYVSMPSQDFALEDADGDLLDTSLDVGEVLFIEDKNIFKLSVRNNEVSTNNLTGSDDPSDYSLQEFVANESIRLNQEVSPSTVILSKQQAESLAETLKIIVMQGAKRVYVSIFSMGQLVGAPQELMDFIKVDFYKNEEDLINKLFETGD